MSAFDTKANETEAAGRSSFVPNYGTPEYYEILGVSTSATRMDIRQAYIRLRQTFSASSQAMYSLMDEPELARLQAKVEEAFNVLNDDGRREAYDRSHGLIPALTQPLVGANAPKTMVAAELSGTPESEARHPAFHAAADESRATQQPTGLKRQYVQADAQVLRADAARLPETRRAAQEFFQSAEPGSGDVLKSVREMLGVSEQELQDRTKVSREYIRAIEANGFERLPKPIFVKGFLRSYVKYLGLEGGEAFTAAFMEKFEAWQKQKST